MKTKSFIILMTTVILMIACKNENQVVIDNISGTWKIEEIVYSQTGEMVPKNGTLFCIKNARNGKG